MIKFINQSTEPPYTKFKDLYELALKSKQKYIEAICVSSFSKNLNEVNSRMVNLKLIDGEKFIFFSNYLSPKSNEFEKHNQISVVIFWDKINIQVRFKALIERLSSDENRTYFEKRSPKKNALAISSKQSSKIESYSMVHDNYKKSLQNDNLKECPNYWGGFVFIPYYIEFWKGHKNRLNKREAYEKKNDDWCLNFLQP